MPASVDPWIADLVADDLPSESAIGDLLGGNVPVGDVVDPGQLPRIRPLLVALSARAVGASRVDAEAQHAAELLHLALVGHDLALGQKGGRRRRIARSVLRTIGDSTLTLRALEIARHASSPEILGEVVESLREIADGRALSREIRQGTVPDEDVWREHADGHAGAVFAFCCRSGAHIGRGNVATVQALGRFGRHLGRLWAGAEDLSQLARPGGDALLVHRAERGRPPLPVICAAAVDPELAARWVAWTRDPHPDVAADLVQRVLTRGGISAAREVMARENWAAQRALGVLDPNVYRRALERLASGLARTETGNTP